MTDLEEVKIKNERIISYLNKNGYDAIVIARKDNFAWITAGGDSKVVKSQETGFGVLVITAEGKKYLIAYSADIDRIYEEELQGLGYEPIMTRWYNKPPVEKALEVVNGGNIVSDISLKNADYRLKDIYDLHYPLTKNEVERYKIVGKDVDKSIAKVVEKIEPGMTEVEVQARLLKELALNQIETNVMLIGSDERVFKYRHPLPTSKKINNYLLISPAVKKWGLHVNISRLVYFGKLTNEIRTKYDAACNIAAAAISECVPGNTFANILQLEKKLYKKYNYSEEWKNNFQGGITGYMIADATRGLVKNEKIVANQTYEWFITITGVKSAELSINDGKDQKILSTSGLWPTKSYMYKGKELNIADILVK